MIYKTDVWDVEFAGKKLTIREGEGKITAEITFSAPSEISIERAIFWSGDYSLTVDKKGVVDRYGCYGMNARAENMKYGFVLNSSEDLHPSLVFYSNW